MTLLRVVVILLLATGGGFMTAACGRQAPAPPPPAPVAEPIASVAPGGFGVTERAFVDLSVATDDQAVKLLDLGAARAASPALRTFATSLAAARRTELGELRGMLAAESVTYVNQHEGHDMPGMPTESELTDLAAATDFDAMFVQLTLAHLSESATVAESAANQVTHPATKDIATRMATERAASLVRLNGLS
ncbi:MAG: DUF305 domain-containing protein [Actinophytocola sp.]|uniref:DUF305 domain-containing protein n=1 Tax=Actinophytocola sp. TaxID=1872138 RepID=UPI001329CB44|nr:DUF305 domain-containing protein [Actinophytocola sp.]MPZ81564.1 DUF305 domain-containing protein [Actinophytocola sp.]